MKKLYIAFAVCLLMAACGAPQNSSTSASADAMPAKDTVTYPYKASFSSDITVPSHPEIGKLVLEVWKAFEQGQIKAKRSSFADTVTYNAASGFHFYGPADTLLAIATLETNSLDSLRFDIKTWQVAHMNNIDEDWVDIWATERQYPKKGRPDTFLTQENWQVRKGKIVYFDQYTAKPVR